jgi:hypothetical protein
LLVTAWIALLLASGFPENYFAGSFGSQISADAGALIAASVVFVGLLLTFVRNAVRELRPFFLPFVVLVAVE